MSKNVIECMARDLYDFIPNGLDGDLHEGFTVGKRGKKMYWYFIWHADTGNASIYTPTCPPERSYIKNEQTIKIHLKAI